MCFASTLFTYEAKKSRVCVFNMKAKINKWFFKIPKPQTRIGFKKNLGLVLVFEWLWNQTLNLVLVTYNLIIKG
jgi:hypothetical protein